MGRRLAVLAVVATGCVVTSPAALARAHTRVRPCGQVQTRIPHTGSVKIFTVSRVSARRLSCARARGFVRTWERLADHGKLPNRADGVVTKGVLVYYRWGRPYRAAGFVCRSFATPGPGPVQHDRVTCGAPAGLVTWRESGRFG
jgi:hypothetical protein